MIKFLIHGCCHHFIRFGVVWTFLLMVPGPLIAGENLCADSVRIFERAARIPPGLVLAVATTESGRWSARTKRALPWPWTIASGKESYYLPSKDAAIAKVRELQARGRTNIDVGCMQINLRYHPDAFTSLQEAFEPDKNVAYGIKFLTQLRNETRSWGRATARYHSRTPRLGNAYRDRVYKLWRDMRRKERPTELRPGSRQHELRKASMSGKKGSSSQGGQSRMKRPDNPLFAPRPKRFRPVDVVPVLRGGGS